MIRSSARPLHRITVIFFDAADTLFEVRSGIGKIYSDIAHRHGTVLDPGELDQGFRHAFEEKSATQPFPMPRDRDGERRWWLEVVSRVLADSMPPARLQPYFNELYEFFRTAEAWLLYPDVRESLNRLRKLRFRLGIISNFDSRLRDILKALAIGPFFEHAAISWEVGAAKPDPVIFESALKAMNVSPGEALHVGDSIKSDIGGAEMAGLIPVLLDRQSIHRDWTGCRRIQNLGQLCDILPGAKEQ